MSEPTAETIAGAPKSGISRAFSHVPGKKALLIVGALAVVTGGGLAGAHYAGLIDTGLIGGRDAASAGSESTAVSEPVYYELPEFVVNLNTGSRRTTFLKLRASLQLDSAQSVPHVGERLPLIIDHFQIYLRELRPEDLDGSAGTYRLREELLKRVQLTLAPVVVTDIVFAEMLVN
jgi:flagellar FliL protein